MARKKRRSEPTPTFETVKESDDDMETFFVDENMEPVWRVCQTRPTTLLTLMLPIFLIFFGSGTVIINEVEL